MYGTIYDFRRSALPDLPLPKGRVRRKSVARGRRIVRLKVGMVVNPRSRRHLPDISREHDRAEVMLRAPDSRAALRRALFEFAAAGIDLLVIDGGDGTVRDVLTCADDAWGDRWPRIAVLPSGKTNALAVDLGLPVGWTLHDAIAAAQRGDTRERAPIEIERRDQPSAPVRGFLFGAGAFVKATEFAQGTHRVGMLDGLAVAVALGWSVGSMLFGGKGSHWSEREPMRLRFAAGSDARGGPMPAVQAERTMMFASTLERLPVGFRPFGSVRAGLKTLVVDGTRKLALSLPALLSGTETPRLAERGYHRVDTPRVDIDLASPFILDGEHFPAGAYTLRQGTPLRFVVP